MQTNKQSTLSSKHLNSSHTKNKKIIKSISEKFIEEYCLKISSKHFPSTTKTKKSSIPSTSPSLLKSTSSQTQISNISTCSTSNNQKTKIVQRNRNRINTQLISSNIQSNKSLKSSSSALNLSKYGNYINNSTNVSIGNSQSRSIISPVHNKINVMKKQKKKFLNKTTSDFLEVAEEIKDACQNKSNKVIKSYYNSNKNKCTNTKSKGNINKNNNEKYTSKINNNIIKNSKVHKCSRNFKSNNVLNIKESKESLNNDKQLYLKKQRLNSSIDNVSCLNHNLSNKSVNKTTRDDDYSVNNNVNNNTLWIGKSFGNSNTNYTNYVVNIKNVDTPEELHFAFVNMNQQQKMVYQKIHNKINENERNTCISARVGMQRKSQNNKNNNTTDESDFQKDNLYYI